MTDENPKKISIGNWQLRPFTEAQRFFLFADAYLRASMAYTIEIDKADDEGVRNWPGASVCMLLAAHSIELFLKSALLAKDIAIERTHALDDLTEQFNDAWAGEGFVFECPFRTEYMGFESIAEIELYRTMRTPEERPSIKYRYPESTDEYVGPHSFDPQSFIAILNNVTTFYGMFNGHMTLPTRK